MIWLALFLALFVGIVVGVLGSGGSVLSVPLLAYVARMDPKQAIAVAHMIVGATSTVAAISFIRAGRVQWRTALLLGSGGFVGAYVGGLLARFFSGAALLLGFASIVAVTGIAVLRGRRDAVEDEEHRALPAVVVALGGLAIGMVSGLVGAGGGVFIVPFLILVGGLPMAYAVGTSLIVGALNSFAGLGGYLSSVHVDWKLGAAFTVITVVGGQIGTHLHARFDPSALRKSFGLFALGISSITFGREINAETGIALAAATVLAGLLIFAREAKQRRAAASRPFHDTIPDADARLEHARQGSS
ncbi:sulfite exporter TauE/SafE family protein [Mycobacterium sp. THU-M104]|uniref:sulfite exporter TauE/SafE family protein n=1 Tax=Mycobacterium sp. THU-M104 TaxID=3410515 RepID=UPI003B9A3C1A